MNYPSTIDKKFYWRYNTYVLTNMPIPDTNFVSDAKITLHKDESIGLYYLEGNFDIPPENYEFEFTTKIFYNRQLSTKPHCVKTDYDILVYGILLFNNRPYILPNERNNTLRITKNMMNYIPVKII